MFLHQCLKFLKVTNRWKTVILVNNIEVTLIQLKFKEKKMLDWKKDPIWKMMGAWFETPSLAHGIPIGIMPPKSNGIC